MKRYADCTCMLCRDPEFRAQVEAVAPRTPPEALKRRQRFIESHQALTFHGSPERQALERAFNAPAAEVYE